MPPKQAAKTGAKKAPSSSSTKPPAAPKQVAPRKPQACAPTRSRGGANLTVGGKGVAKATNKAATTAKVKVVKTKSPTSKEDKDKKDVKKVWSAEDEMAKRIQAYYRRYRSRKLKLELKRKKEEYDNLMEKLQREVESQCPLYEILLKW